jgi:hypothetical protein
MFGSGGDFAVWQAAGSPWLDFLAWKLLLCASGDHMMMTGRSDRNATGWRCAPIALVLVAAGCSGSKGTGGDTASTFCDSYWHTLTSKFVSCQGGSVAAYNEALQTLDLCGAISTDLALGKLTYSPQRGQACLSEIAATDCSTLASEGSAPADCTKAFTGTVAAGSACYRIPIWLAQECAPGSHCAAETQCPGICQPDGALGITCDTVDQCARPLICGLNGSGVTCMAPPPDIQVGAACGSTDQCISENVRLICEGPSGPLDGYAAAGGSPTSGFCQKPRATGPCSQNSDCSTNNCVFAGSGATTGTCTVGKVIGDACVPGQNQCGALTYCGTANRCVDLPTLGHSCAGNAGEGQSCATGVCNSLTSLCVQFLAAGQTCSGGASQCDGFNTQCGSSGVCLPTCAPGSACGAPGQICCAQNLCNASLTCNGTTCGEAPPGTDGGRDAHVSTGIAITPNAMGYFDGSNAAGVLGAWWATGDDYDFTGTPGAGNCPMAGFADAQCSSIATPTPGKPFTPNPTGTGMCTSGIAARVLPGDGGVPAYSAMWGDLIGFDLNDPSGFYNDAGVLGADAGLTSKGQYDASAHKVTGIAFDIDTPPVGNLRVEFQTMGTENNSAYWGGFTSNTSPVFAGHNEIRWSDVGGPSYVTNPPRFDPTTLEDVDFHVIDNPGAPVPYSFCVNNVVMLTN